MFDYSLLFDSALEYGPFLERYGSADQRARWKQFHDSVTLSPAQRTLLQSFVREMKVLVMAGTWCGDCVNQCPIFDHFQRVNPLLRVRFVDRDDRADVAAELSTCGAPRVPCVVFLNEDGQFCGRYGDRTLTKYRQMNTLTGAACATGLSTTDMTAAVVSDWLNEWERIQHLLRTSSRLRQKHGD